jgi:spore coat protein CotH
VVVWGVVCLAMGRAADIRSKSFSAADFFAMTHVWTARFAFTQDQWKGLAPVPKQGRGFAAGRPLSRFEAQVGLRNGITGNNGLSLEYVHGDLTIDGLKFANAGIRYKGNGTLRRGIPLGKVSLKADLNKYVAGQKLGKISKLNFNNNVSDTTWMHEVLAYRLYRDAGVPASRTSYARVYIDVAGLNQKPYKGLYSIVEEVDGRFAEDHFGTKDGLLFKPVIPSTFTYLGEEWKPYSQVYDPKREPGEAEKRRVIEFSRIVTRGTDAEFAARAAEFVDFEEFARYMAVTVWLSNYDSILDNGQNYYLYLDSKTKKFSFVPWDLDRAFGQFGVMGGDMQRVDILRPWAGRQVFLERMFRLEAFRKLYLADMAEFNRTIFRPERFGPQVAAIAAAVRPAIAEESMALLERFDASVAGRTMPDTLDRNFGLPDIPITTFVKGRAVSVEEQLGRIGAGEKAGGFPEKPAEAPPR